MLTKRIRSRLLKLPQTARYLAARARWRLTTHAPPAVDPAGERWDAAWYRRALVQSVDRFNGGLDQRTGMGVYRDDFSGFFHVALDRRWLPMPLLASSSNAQSRAIYINAEAYRAAEDNARFLKAMRQGVGFLLSAFGDSRYGGFFWQVTPAGKIADETKDGYGNVHPLFALAEAYSVTRDPAHLHAALDQLDVIEAHFWDKRSPGGVLTRRSRDFSAISGVHNLNPVVHLFEALLALYDASAGAPHQRAADLIAQQGNFITGRLYRDQAGYADRGYLAYYYDDDWQPSQTPYSPQARRTDAAYATLGHAVEVAYLLSRAVERGFDPDWLDTAHKLLKFVLIYGLDPVSGGLMHEITDYAGQPFAAEPNRLIGWAQLETARALLHFSVVRGDQYQAEFRRVEALYHERLIDPVYGGVYEALDGDQPTHTHKANLWLVNYHHAMFLAEVVRLAEAYPKRAAENPVTSR